MMQDALLYAVLFVNAYFLLATLSNVAYFRRATRTPTIRSGPFVSVIVPARDEERSIARCLESLRGQDYADFEVIVVDDQSSDATALIAAGFAARDPRVRLVCGDPLPEGWLGKQHALSQGAAVARGEILVLTDADTVHSPDSISWAVTNLQHQHADVLSGYIEQEYGSFGEDLIVPTMYAMMLLLPLLLLPRTRNPRIAFAIGQYVVIRRDALDAVGGFGAISESIVDDMSMAIRMKESGYRNVFLDAKRVVSCRLYRGYRDAFHGIARSIYSSLGGQPFTAVAVGAIILAVIVWPTSTVLLSALNLEAPSAALAMSAALFAMLWALVAWDRDVPFVGFVLYPLVFLNLVAILGVSMVSTGFGRGMNWKGRTVRAATSTGTANDTELADASSEPDEEA